MFNLFAENLNGCAGDPRVYRERWLLLQLRPSFVHPQHWDIFDELSCKLSGATDSFINTKTKTLLTNVRSLLCSGITIGSHTTQAQMSTSDTAQTPFFCVLDEAQHAATQHNTAFRSDQNGAHRPILREIVKAWESQSFGQGVFMVVAGTGISKDVVDQAMASAIMKDSRYRWCSDTGAFDRKDVQQRYMQKYLPKRLLESDVGVRLLERVWYWLHGRFVQLGIPHRLGTQCRISRYRFTAGFVAELLVDGFKRPHGLLNAYVQHFTNFNVTDAPFFIKAEGSDPLPLLSQYRLDFSKLKKSTRYLADSSHLTDTFSSQTVTCCRQFTS